MNLSSLKKVLANGLALAVPIGIIVYVFIKLLEIFEKLIGPVSKKFGVDHLLGELTLTIFAVFILLVLVFILGMLRKLPLVKKFSLFMEEVVMKVFPSFSYLKTMGAEKFDIEEAGNTWKPVIIKKENELFPALLIDENNDWVTLIKVKAPGTDLGDFLICQKRTIKIQETTIKEMKQLNKQYGKGYLKYLA
jgi:hypothetical protein